MYTLVYTEPFNDDIESIRDYFRSKKEKRIGANLVNSIIKKLNHLELMPFSRALVQDELLASDGYRSLQIKNYILLFTIDMENMVVYLERIFHGSQDWMNILKEDLEDENI